MISVVSVYIVHSSILTDFKTLRYESFGYKQSSLGLKFLLFCPFYVLSIDCESHCKTSKGKMKITMKKYCKKDYGKSNM